MKPFEFDKATYTGKEIKDRIKYYIYESLKGIEYANAGSKSEAKKILVNLRKEIAIEHTYYKRLNFEKILSSLDDVFLKEYVHSIMCANALSGINSVNWNLDEIIDYLSDIDLVHIDDDSIHGHSYYEATKEKLDSINNNDKRYRLLQSLSNFYLSPHIKGLNLVRKEMIKYNPEDFEDIEHCFNIKLIEIVEKG